MSFDFNKYRESQNIVSISFENKSEYYLEIHNIEDSMTGRLDAQICNYFIREASQLVVNSISLFEKGFFDAAYYSLRQSIEVATTMVYLVEISPEEQKKELIKWKRKSKFPMYSQMIQLLEKKSIVFNEIRESLNKYFSELKSIKNDLNKYVHKQGFDTFYTLRQNPRVVNNDIIEFKLEFERYLKKSIGAIAVFRLFIDPFPILLTDQKIFNRTGDLLTSPYDEEFIDRFIGRKHIEKYKQSDFYQSFYNSIIKEEEQLHAVNQLIKNQFIDTSKVDEILSQRHLLSAYDIAAVSLSSLSNNISTIYCLRGLQMYFTEINSNRKSMSFSSSVLDKFALSDKRIT